VIRFVGPEVEDRLDWLALTDALAAGHLLPRATLGDTFLSRGADTVLSRAASIDGLGALVKTATVFPGNAGRGLPTVNGAATVFSDEDGTLEAMVDFHLLTRWKTAGDSLLAARRLAPPSVRLILIVGAGAVAGALREAYGAAFPSASFRIWNRNSERAAEMAARFPATEAVPDLADAVTAADIVSSATMARAPIIEGRWLRPGQHVDLIGAFRADMREADDDALTRSRIFVDSRGTVLDHIGELRDPIARGVIGRADVVADYCELEKFTRDAGDITLFKNGGGAHLDLMTARYILSVAGTD
jgi:ornithine cyclodeaminase/alanine dehydrogenase-like protein (mu-crystallin family)